MLRLRAGSCELLTEDVVETLERHKYFTVLDLCKCNPDIVAENCGIPVKNIVSIQRLLQAQHSAKVVSAVDVYRDLLTSTGGFSTGIDGLDSLLDGGIISGETIELYGKAASGKTQICFHITAHIAAVARQPVLYVDTCGSFSAERIKKIMSANKVSDNQVAEALSRISCLPCFNVYDFLVKLEDLLHCNVQKNELHCRLIIIDSIATLLLPSIGGSTMEGHGVMNRIANKLKELAVRNRKIVLTTNHLITWENKSYAALGKFWSHFPHIRLKLSVEKEDDLGSPYRMVEVEKSTRTACGKCAKIKLTSRGCEGAV